MIETFTILPGSKEFKLISFVEKNYLSINNAYEMILSLMLMFNNNSYIMIDNQTTFYGNFNGNLEYCDPVGYAFYKKENDINKIRYYYNDGQIKLTTKENIFNE